MKNRDDIAKLKEMLKARAICVVIPTYNNEGTIAQVVRDTQKFCDDIFVVNDGSTDATSHILRQIENINIVEYEQNKGKGYALKRGFRKALECGFAYAITLDADGQHYPSDIPLFVDANKEFPGALIVGERNLKDVQRTKGSGFANKFSNFWFCVQTGKNLADTQTGYRLYPIKKLVGLSMLTSRYEAELELMVFASWHGVEIKSIPINVYYPPKEERVTHFRPGKDFARISLLNVVLCLLALVYGLPLRLLRWGMRVFRTLFSLLFFCFFMLFVITPMAWLYIKIGKTTTKKRDNLHKLIYHASRFVMLHAGIPGAKFSCKIADGVDFDKPHVIICNHQSHLDLVCQLIFTPKMIFLTNDWVWKNPFYGFLIREAEFYPVNKGIEAALPKLAELVKRGYSIAVYPEGTRSKTCKIGRFHQGAFFLAENLGLDILPMCLYGAGKVLPKTSLLLKKGQIYIEVDNPITRAELSNMGSYMEQASTMREWYRSRYEDICNKIEQDA
ncbi:MAG: glycosyltransferase [Prevotella sp.]|nr:glycosyltransferase [Prevotella sp.]